ncbi:MAG: adenylosuccinate lyase [Anaerolineae bacterium]
MSTFDHSTFLSPLTWRYGSEEMRRIWSEEYKRRLWRRIWVALAEAQAEQGLVTREQVEDLRAHMDEIDLERAEEIERVIHHDLMAEVKVFAEQCPLGGPIIHLGATSMDIEDNADALRLRESLELIIARLKELIAGLAEQIEHWADTPAMAFTHLQPAEPTTIGYRLAQYGQDLLFDLLELRRLRRQIRGKGLKGAVGTGASYVQLLGRVGARRLERSVMDKLGLRAYPVATQIYPRKQDWAVLNALAGLAGTLYRFAFDLRVLQSPAVGEWSEPFGAQQVGSSAMPFKRNPVNAENIDSLARYVAVLPRVLWDDAAHSLLERTLDDSANRRLVLPAAFLCTDEIVRRANRIVRGLQVNETAVARNLERYGVFAATERLLMEAVKAGGDRQQLHEVIREHSMAAWAEVSAGRPNPLAERLSSEPAFTRLLPARRIRALLDASDYVGDAPQLARAMAAVLRKEINEPEEVKC